MGSKKTTILLVSLLLFLMVNLKAKKQLVTMDDILLSDVESLANNETVVGAPTCAAGGCNAKSCSFSGEIEILGNGVVYTNSVECVDAWACCFTTAYCFDKGKCQ